MYKSYFARTMNPHTTIEHVAIQNVKFKNVCWQIRASVRYPSPGRWFNLVFPAGYRFWGGGAGAQGPVWGIRRGWGPKCLPGGFGLVHGGLHRWRRGISIQRSAGHPLATHGGRRLRGPRSEGCERMERVTYPTTVAPVRCNPFNGNINPASH